MNDTNRSMNRGKIPKYIAIVLCLSAVVLYVWGLFNSSDYVESDMPETENQIDQPLNLHHHLHEFQEKLFVPDIGGLVFITFNFNSQEKASTEQYLV